MLKPVLTCSNQIPNKELFFFQAKDTLKDLLKKESTLFALLFRVSLGFLGVLPHRI